MLGRCWIGCAADVLGWMRVRSYCSFDGPRTLLGLGRLRTSPKKSSTLGCDLLGLRGRPGLGECQRCFGRDTQIRSHLSVKLMTSCESGGNTCGTSSSDSRSITLCPRPTTPFGLLTTRTGTGSSEIACLLDAGTAMSTGHSLNATGQTYRASMLEDLESLITCTTDLRSAHLDTSNRFVDHLSLALCFECQSTYRIYRSDSSNPAAVSLLLARDHRCSRRGTYHA